MVVLSALICSACACLGPADYVDVSFSDLVARPWQYDGQRVRVRGYLVYFGLGNPEVERCYGDDAAHRFIATSLPVPTVLGDWDGSYHEFDGRLVTIVGVFRNSPRPGEAFGDFAFIGSGLDVERRIVGPIRHARIESMSNERCIRIGESGRP